MELTKKELAYWFAGISVLGPVKRKKLLDVFGTEQNIFSASMGALTAVHGIEERDEQAICSSRNIESIKAAYQKMEEKKITLVPCWDAQYPEKLKQIAKPPYALFCRGKMPDEKKLTVAIVGARNCTPYGKRIAMWFAKELSLHGVQVISGMAYGIDGCAHRGALQGEEPTYAVLGSGIDVCYPQQHFDLFLDIPKRGGILSEYPPGVPGRAFQFPMRNRIISALSDAVLVVEARERSGSLITADLALEQGKEVFAIPGRIGDPLSKGCLELIKQGAEPVAEPADILKNYHMVLRKERQNVNLIGRNLTEEKRKIYEVLSLEPKTLEEIMTETKLIMWRVAELLLEMELEGYVKQCAMHSYIRAV